MDPICEEKINFLQKYVPFLANLIELLANDSEKEGKLAQMQLLYNLLNKPDNSVKIETLEKCEEVLSRVFGSTDEKSTEPQIDLPFPLPIIKIECTENIDETEEQDNMEKNCENLNGHLENTDKETNCVDSHISQQQLENTAENIQKPSSVNEVTAGIPMQVDVEDSKAANSSDHESKVENISSENTDKMDIDEDVPETSLSEDNNDLENEKKVRKIEEECISIEPTSSKDETQENKLEIKTNIAQENSQETLSTNTVSDAVVKEIIEDNNEKQIEKIPKNSNDDPKENTLPIEREVVSPQNILAETADDTVEGKKSLDKTENETEVMDQTSEKETILKDDNFKDHRSNDALDNDTKTCNEVDQEIQNNKSEDTESNEDSIDPKEIKIQEQTKDVSMVELKITKEVTTGSGETSENSCEDLTDCAETSRKSLNNDTQIESNKDQEIASTEVTKSDTKEEQVQENKTTSPKPDSSEEEVQENKTTSPKPDSSEEEVQENKTTSPKPDSSEEEVQENKTTSPKPDSSEEEVQEYKATSPKPDSSEEEVQEYKATSPKPDSSEEEVQENKTTSPKADSSEEEVQENKTTLPKADSSEEDPKSDTCEDLNQHQENTDLPVCESENVDLPEEGDSAEPSHSNNENPIELEEKEESNIIIHSQTEMLPFKIISAESLATKASTSTEMDDTELENADISLHETTKEDNESEKNVDPLNSAMSPQNNSIETPKSVPEKESSDKNDTTTKNKDDDDDDVLLVETRSSPICIDSDPEEEETIKIKGIPPHITVKPVVNRQTLMKKPTAIRSASAVIDSLRHMIKHQHARKKTANRTLKPPQNSAFLLKKDPKALMETINLIDSDSDDESKKDCKKSNSKTDDDVIIVSSTQPPQRRMIPMKKIQQVPTPKRVIYSPKVSNRTPPKPATAQSNFLNAVNLQPTSKSDPNPATFSAQLSNKKVIIPNAFYGNPSYNRRPQSSGVFPVEETSSNDSISRSAPSTPSVFKATDQDDILMNWLEGFLTNFSSPLQIASHACFVLLQRVLKYRFFQRLKESRVHLNTMAKNCISGSMDVQMLLDLRNVFIQNGCLTDAGRRFCRFATNDAFGKPVALTTDTKTGKVTCRTRIGSKNDIPLESSKAPKAVIIEKPTSTPTATATATSVVKPAPKPIATVSPAASATFSSPPSVPKRKGKFRKLSDGLVVAVNDEDDNDYTPNADEMMPEEVVTERKRSLRTNRTKRKEAGFTYSEDHDDEEFEALAKKIEDKKREELRLAEERELEKEKELERKANKKTIAKKTTAKRQGSTPTTSQDNAKEPSRKKLRLANPEIIGNADDDLLTPTWVEAEGDDGEVDSLLDFAEEPQSPTQEPQDNGQESNEVVDDSQDIEDPGEIPKHFNVNTNKALKNTDRSLHVHNKSQDFCVHCQRRVPRIVHHYVNEHRLSEVFPSRLQSRDVRRLLTTNNVGFSHLYKGNQIQYAAHCIFCGKDVKFLMSYWFEHFTMHTGEYSFKCSGCQILKPTRSLLTNHIQSGSGCPKKGKAIRLYNFDTKTSQIEAYICSLCNFTQMHKKNLLRHLRTQHELSTITSNHIIKVVLLQISGPYREQQPENNTNNDTQLALLQYSDDETDVNGESLDESSLMMQNDFTDNDDLSFMICGMLDVQTTLTEPGLFSTNTSNTNNTVDNE